MVMPNKLNGERSNMKIKVGKTTYKVISIDKFPKHDPCKGRIYYDKKVILIAERAGVTNRKYSPVEIAQTVVHEVVHAVLYDMKEHTLNKNEKFVDGLAKRFRVLRFIDDIEEREGKDELVPQRPKRLRKLRKKVPRSKSAKAVPARQNRANSVRRKAT